MDRQMIEMADVIPPPPETLEQIMNLALGELRVKLVFWLGQHLCEERELRIRSVRKLQSIFSEIDDGALETLRQDYFGCGDDIRFYPVALTGRRLGHAFLSNVVQCTRIEGLENLSKAHHKGPTLLVSNHLSYADSQTTEYLTAKLGDEEMARRLTFVAGPKVYENPFRRMAALSLNTIPTAQSARLSYNRANQSPREVAQIALKSIRKTIELMREGYQVLLYAEGTRSRTGRLGSFLKGTCRYAQVDGLHIVPVALTGTETMFPIHESRLRPTEITLRYGEPIPVESPHATQEMVAAWHALAELLPPGRQPEKNTPPLV